MPETNPAKTTSPHSPPHSVTPSFDLVAGYINDPQLSTHNLKRAVEAHGGRLLFNRSFTDVRRADGRVSGVTLDGGEQIDAHIVINIAGPHSRLINDMAGVEGDMKINTRPLRHEVQVVRNPNPARV